MILFKLSKNKNPKIQKAYGKYYARPVVTQTIDLNALAEHMTEHNTGFSPGATKGLLTDMVKCIKELVLQGFAVKIDDLAIFSIGLKTKKGADSEEDFSVAKNIEGVRLRARATGNLTSNKLDIQASRRMLPTSSPRILARPLPHLVLIATEAVRVTTIRTKTTPSLVKTRITPSLAAETLTTRRLAVLTAVRTTNSNRPH